MEYWHAPETTINRINMTDDWLAKLLELDRAIHAANPAYHIDDTLEKLRDFMDSLPNCANYALMDPEGLVGYLTLADADQLREVANIGIHPSHQGQGYGRLLLEFAETQARAWGAYTGMKILTSTENPAQAFYEHMGYERAGIVENYDGAGEPGYLFLKTFEPGPA